MFSSSLEERCKGRGFCLHLSSPEQRSDSAQGGWLGVCKCKSPGEKMNLKINPFFFFVCLVNKQYQWQIVNTLKKKVHPNSYKLYEF